ncbi:MAG: hypothetical protein R6X31_13340 [Anaerolineae bacterium]
MDVSESFGEATFTTRPEAISTPFLAQPGTSSEGQTWLVMLYQNADDKILEQDIYVDLNAVGVWLHQRGSPGYAGATGAPREIIPRSGDTFTVLEKWLDLDEQGRVVQQAQLSVLLDGCR